MVEKVGVGDYFTENPIKEKGKKIRHLTSSYSYPILFDVHVHHPGDMHLVASKIYTADYTDALCM